jgi:hypothetical protein
MKIILIEDTVKFTAENKSDAFNLGQLHESQTQKGYSPLSEFGSNDSATTTIAISELIDTLFNK